LVRQRFFQTAFQRFGWTISRDLSCAERTVIKIACLNGGKSQRSRKFEFLLEIAGEIVVPGELDRWGKGSVSLNKTLRLASRPVRRVQRLVLEAERFVRPPEIRQMQSEIGV